MVHSEACTELVSLFEGFKDSAYQDQNGIWTLGFGRTLGIKEGDTCTYQQAKVWLDADLLKADKAVNALVKVVLTQSEFDALVSLTYNIGQHNFAESTVRRKLNQGDPKGAGEAFMMWVRAGGDISNGLVKRRDAERALFLGEIQ